MRRKFEFAIAFLAGMISALLLFAINTSTTGRIAVELLQAALVPIIAIVTVYIAYRQARNDETRVRLELFSKRFRAFEALRKVRADVVSQHRAEVETLAELRSVFPEVPFLFDRSIMQFFDEVRQNESELKQTEVEIEEGARSGTPAPQRLIDKRNRLRDWFENDLEKALIERFSPFLKLEG